MRVTLLLPTGGVLHDINEAHVQRMRANDVRDHVSRELDVSWRVSGGPFPADYTGALILYMSLPLVNKLVMAHRWQ